MINYRRDELKTEYIFHFVEAKEKYQFDGIPIVSHITYSLVSSFTTVDDDEALKSDKKSLETFFLAREMRRVCRK